MTDFIIATLVIIIGGIALFVAVAFWIDPQWYKLMSKRDYGEKLDYGDDIYGPSLMDVEDEE